MKTRPQVPLATYRLQFNRDFTFAQATELVPYLACLGISHCYASPLLKARPGSTHGYDIVDHNSINPEIGTPEEFDRFVETLHQHGMGLILDVVPNHMGIMGSDNAWWLDVLENGEASVHGSFFDIDWEPIKSELRGKVLVPVLADQYGAVLEKGELKLTFDGEKGELSIFYHEHRFPIDPREYPRVLESCAIKSPQADTTEALEFQSLVASFGHLPDRHETAPERIAERHRDKEIHKRRLAELTVRSPELAGCIRHRVETMNGTPGSAASFEELHELIKAQAFRLAQWRVATDDINYRRFFDINHLAAIRIQDPQVYEETHRLIFRLMAEDKVDGLRIDHPDGLYHPTEYFERLQNSFSELSRNGNDQPSVKTRRYLVIEKILTGSERLRPEWPVSGTTGYDFANLLNGVFISSESAARMDGAYRAFLGEKISFDEVAYDARKLILRYSLASELNVLATQLIRLALSKRHTCDFTLNGLRDALTEVVANFPVYRTYVTRLGMAPEDKRYIELAVARAKHRSPAGDTSIFDFLRDVLLTRIAEGQDMAYRAAVTSIAMKFQQFSSPVMAKGVEDTAFYRYNRLVSLNEVGGDPQKFGTAVAEFHRANQERLKHWPDTMLAATTHDTKRSEDVRARLNVLSEIPALWRLRLRHWKKFNRTRKKVVSGAHVPSLNEEYLLYQTLLGVWPFGPLEEKQQWQALAQRVEQYMLKAVREAKENTSWVNQNTEYEGALAAFIKGVLTPGAKNRFLADCVPFQRYVAHLGIWNSLSQTLLKLTAPGVPDTYQGSELWDLRLVDPDNRAPVDYSVRQELLRQLQTEAESAEWLRTLMESPTDGRIKLYLVWKVLRFRQRYQPLFQRGGYLPLQIEGARANHVCAFARNSANATAIVVAPRLLAGILNGREIPPLGAAVWGDTQLILPSGATSGNYTNVFTGQALTVAVADGVRSLAMSAALSDFPVALLINDSGSGSLFEG